MALSLLVKNWPAISRDRISEPEHLAAADCVHPLVAHGYSFGLQPWHNPQSFWKTTRTLERGPQHFRLAIPYA